MEPTQDNDQRNPINAGYNSFNPNLQPATPVKRGGKGIWLLILVVVAVVCGGGYLYYMKAKPNSPVFNKSVISSWKVYENKDFGFSFSYPEELSFKEESTINNLQKDLQLDSFVINDVSDYSKYLKEGKPNYKFTLYGRVNGQVPPQHSQSDCDIADTRTDVERLECGVVNINGSSFVRVLYKLNDKSNNGSLELVLLGTINFADFIADVHIPSGSKQKYYSDVIESMLGTIQITPLNTAIPTAIAPTPASSNQNASPRPATNLKTLDQKILSNLSNIRPAAAFYWDKYQNYGKPVSGKSGCTASGSMFTSSIFLEHGSVNPTTYPSGTQITCNVAASGQAYAVQASLASGGYWCIDDHGSSKAEKSDLGSNTECQ